MKIRSITYFADTAWPLNQDVFDRAGRFVSQAKAAFESAGYEVQTARFATTPFSVTLGNRVQLESMPFAQELEKAAQEHGYDYASMGPALPTSPESFGVIPEILRATQSIFVSGVIATYEDGISLPATRACAKVIRDCASILPDGFANLRFAALANVPPGTPFFPAGYNSGKVASFAVATEAADLAVEAISGAQNLAKAKERLVESIEAHGTQIESLAESVAISNDLIFGGIDFSFAPFPTVDRSIGKAIELLGAPNAGLHGSLAAAGFLTDALESARFNRAGFNGLFLPPLEDAVLAQRAADGVLGITELLLYSAVCGTGLDTVPLPGDVSSEQLAAILLDLAVLSLRLGKPLTARLMPVPGKKAGDRTEFDFPYFANSRILSVKAEPLIGLFAGGEILRLGSRKY